MGLLNKVASFIRSPAAEAGAATVESVGQVLGDLFTSDDERLSHADIRARLALKADQLAETDLADARAHDVAMNARGPWITRLWNAAIRPGFATLVGSGLYRFMWGDVHGWAPLKLHAIPQTWAWLFVAVIGF